MPKEQSSSLAFSTLGTSFTPRTPCRASSRRATLSSGAMTALDTISSRRQASPRPAGAAVDQRTGARQVQDGARADFRQRLRSRRGAAKVKSIHSLCGLAPVEGSILALVSLASAPSAGAPASAPAPGPAASAPAPALPLRLRLQAAARPRLSGLSTRPARLAACPFEDEGAATAVLTRPARPSQDCCCTEGRSPRVGACAEATLNTRRSHEKSSDVSCRVRGRDPPAGLRRPRAGAAARERGCDGNALKNEDTVERIVLTEKMRLIAAHIAAKHALYTAKEQPCNPTADVCDRVLIQICSQR